MGEDGFCEFTRIDPKATIHRNNGVPSVFYLLGTQLSGHRKAHMSYSLMPQKLRALHPANGLRFSRRSHCFLMRLVRIAI